jgi:hypothetical protein
MVVGFTTIYAISAYHQENVSPGAIYTTLYVQSLSATSGRKVCGYLWVLPYPPPKKNTDYQDITEILLKVAIQKKINNANNLKRVV